MIRVDVSYRDGRAESTYVCANCAAEHGVRLPKGGLNLEMRTVSTAWLNGTTRKEPCRHPAHGSTPTTETAAEGRLPAPGDAIFAPPAVRREASHA